MRPISEIMPTFKPGNAAPEAPNFERRERAEETIASIPPRFRWARFGSADLVTRVRPASAVAKAIEATGPTVVLLGAAGFGKTSLGCALLRRFAKETDRIGRFADAIDLAYARKMHPLGQGEAPDVADAMSAGVLFLDELGAEQGMDQAVEQLIRKRHNLNRPTIYGTPHDPNALRARYGDGVARRVFENATVIKLGAQ